MFALLFLCNKNLYIATTPPKNFQIKRNLPVSLLRGKEELKRVAEPKSF
jgi:hypothetical protein